MILSSSINDALASGSRGIDFGKFGVTSSQLGLSRPLVQQNFPRPPFVQQSAFSAPFVQQNAPDPPLEH